MNCGAASVVTTPASAPQGIPVPCRAVRSRWEGTRRYHSYGASSPTANTAPGIRGSRGREATGRRTKRPQLLRASWLRNPFGSSDDADAAVSEDSQEVETLTAEMLPEFLARGGPNLAMVDFYTKWCGPCKVVEKEMARMALKYERVLFGKYDCEDAGNEELASELGIQELPTVILYRNGSELRRFSGVGQLGEVMGMAEIWNDKAREGSLPP
mmetsp:Transcript_1555/g.3932  ORF Transcript_1555/g.3932 Transcript_1555/m.3932 type:complete len:213 (+) Transcript_1555:173-811(+)